MAVLVYLSEDGNLGKAGDSVWVDDPSDVDNGPSGSKQPTVAELREQADALGIDHSGLKKADLVAAIEAKQAEQPQ